MHLSRRPASLILRKCRLRRVFHTKVTHNYQSSCTADIFLFADGGENVYLSFKQETGPTYERKRVHG
jgi:hypothetical protein